MTWEVLRDLGLVMFAVGAIAAFVLSRVLQRQLGTANVAIMATVGDAMMLVGACLAAGAMAIGFLVSNASPT